MLFRGGGAGRSKNLGNTNPQDPRLPKATRGRPDGFTPKVWQWQDQAEGWLFAATWLLFGPPVMVGFLRPICMVGVTGIWVMIYMLIGFHHSKGNIKYHQIKTVDDNVTICYNVHMMLIL